MRECTAIKKGDRGWSHIVTVDTTDMDVRQAERLLTTRDGNTLYDVRIHDETGEVWIKKKDISQANYVTKRL